MDLVPTVVPAPRRPRVPFRRTGIVIVGVSALLTATVGLAGPAAAATPSDSGPARGGTLTTVQQVIATSGFSQTAPAGSVFARPLTVSTAATGGAPVARGRVTFTVVSGSASFPSGASATVTGSDNGEAASPSLIAGRDAGTVVVAAASGSAAAVKFTETVAASTSAPPVGITDLSVAVTVPPVLPAGQSVPATITVTNNGPLSSSPALVGAMPGASLSITDGGGGAVLGSVALFVAPALAPNATASYAITVDPRTAVPTTASLSAGVIPTILFDPNYANNFSTIPVVTTTVTPTTTDGTVYAWGSNVGGQLGDGTSTSSASPVHVSGLTGVTAIAGGASAGYALKSDGTVYAWGYNFLGQLGDGTSTSSATPVQVSGLTGVTAIAGGGDAGYALKSDGTVYAWGSNGSGARGHGTSTSSATPVQVSGLTGVTAIAGGAYAGYALKSDGTVYAWGSNALGQLGDGTTTNSSATPVQVSGLTGVTAIAGGGSTGYALKSDGTVDAWGYNFFGQLGDGTTTTNGCECSPTPVPVSGLTGVTAIAGGGAGYALKSDGTVYAWGSNVGGQLGDGTSTSSATPVPVSGLTGVTAIAGGAYTGYALKSDGTVYAWGSNGFGELGDGTTTSSATPVQVSGLTGVTAIAGGIEAGYALKPAPPK